MLQSVQKKKGISIDDRQTGLVSLEDIQSAERKIIKSVQEGYFKDEIEALKKKQRLKARICIFRDDSEIKKDIKVCTVIRIKAWLLICQRKYPVGPR